METYICSRMVAAMNLVEFGRCLSGESACVECLCQLERRDKPAWEKEGGGPTSKE